MTYYYTGIFTNGNSINESLCIEKIRSNLKSNNDVVNYPSTLGDDCDCAIKQQLVIYLV